MLQNHGTVQAGRGKRLKAKKVPSSGAQGCGRSLPALTLAHAVHLQHKQCEPLTAIHRPGPAVNLP